MNYNQSEIESTTIKIVSVGDGAVGKTCILLSYTTDKFPSEYIPTVFENYTTQININGRSVNLQLWDTAGQESYEQLRTLSYPQTQAFLIIFSVIDFASYENATVKWFKELSDENLNLKEVPKILVGNKIDLRNEQDQKHVQREIAQKMATNLGCKYYECSALNQKGLKEIFEIATIEGLNYVDKQNNKEPLDKKKTVQVQSKSSCCTLQ